MAFGLSSGIHPTARTGLWLRAFGASAIAIELATACAGQSYGTVPPPEGYHAEKDTAVTAVNQRPDANRVLQMRRAHLQMQRFAVANLERRRQLLADSEQLLQLATELTVEFQKAGEANLSQTAKADMIEKLAHAVQEKMKLTVALQ